ncbi:MAG: T9SS type A sorting domain-containing protein [Crocinitomicaceae bacterium]|nr:T9SS type A sorting domain-containing protein [Crocinitomicaceae bacterium]
MRKTILTYVFFLTCFNLKSQPPLNQWYDLGGTQSLINSIHSTDSCYYFTGLAHGAIPPISWNLVFAKMDYNGSVVSQTNYVCDTIGVNGINCVGSNLLPTLDGNFITVNDYDDVFLITKFSPDGDTIASRFITHYQYNQNFTSIWPSKIIQNQVDSSYAVTLTIQHNLTLEMRIGLAIYDKNLTAISFKTVPILLPGYAYIYSRDINYESDGFLLSSDIVKPGITLAEDTSRTMLVKTDLSGNEQWRWIDWDFENEAFSNSLTSTPDGGYLYAGISGAYKLETNSNQYVASVTKLGNTLNEEWQITLGDSIGESGINFTDIKPIGMNEFVVCGYQYSGDSSVIGSLVAFNLSGQILWDSYFTFVNASDIYNYPWHELYEVEITPDGGYLLAGKAEDWVALGNGNPGSFGWVVKTDSVGCLVPGCQDFFSVSEIEKPKVQISLYPNPAKNLLNIYYYDPLFSSGELMQVFDLQGKLIRELPIKTNDITYLYDISALTVGTYILMVTNHGLERASVKFVVE